MAFWEIWSAIAHKLKVTKDPEKIKAIIFELRAIVDQLEIAWDLK